MSMHPEVGVSPAQVAMQDGFMMENLRLPPGTLVFQVPYKSGQVNPHPQDTTQQQLPQYPVDPQYPVYLQYPRNLQNPVNPQNSMIPQNPVMLQNQVNPQNSMVPQNPVMLQNPVNPQNSMVPQNPVMLQNQVNPQNSMVPQNPVMLQNPVNPQNTVVPQNPVMLQNPVNPQNPVISENSVTQPQDAPQLSQNPELPTKNPGMMMCPHCQRMVLTKVERKIGLLVCLVAVLVFIFFPCLFPLALIPFFVKTCKDVEHSCPNCNQVLRTYKRA